MLKRVTGALAVLALTVSMGAASAVFAEPVDERGRYIVVFEDSVENPALLARAQTEQVGGRLGFVYRYALNGYSADLRQGAVDGLRRDPRVKYVVADRKVEAGAQTVPTGINRIFAAANKTLDVDSVDDLRIKVDVAVIDSGVEHTHPDLAVVERTDCVTVEPECVDESGTDETGHGTHIAGTIGAIDNGAGVVGVAAGARIWSVRVLWGKENLGWTTDIIAGIDWVTAKQEDEDSTNDIEVANMSFWCDGCEPAPFNEALANMTASGVVAVTIAGNDNVDAKNSTPANSPDAITVSALADYDGKPEGKGSPTCANKGPDDQLASFSNFGAVVDVVAPGVCIYSTTLKGTYESWSGTSMAAPHVTGAAAILAAQETPESKGDVEAIKETIERTGNLNWTDTSGDESHEPLLDMSNELVFWGLPPPPTFFTNVGSTGSGNGQFNAPADVEVAPATGDLLVADKGNNRIQRLNSKGEYVSQFGSKGAGNGQFESPRGVAVDSQGNIWVADQSNYRIQKFTSGGTFIKSCGSKGTGPGQFSEKGPKAIAVGAEDSVWVTDYSNRVLKFNYNCSYVTSITGFTETAGIDIAAETLWITDWSADKVKVYSEAGAKQLEFGTAGSGAGQINGPDGIEVDSKGNAWILETENDRVQQFVRKGEEGEYRSQFGSGIFTVTQSVGIASDGKGGLWFAHNTGNRLQKWVVPNYAPSFYANAGSTGSGNGQFNAPADVEVDPATGDLLVADKGNNRIQRLNSKGVYVSQFGSKGTGNGQFESPRGIAVDSKGNIWVADQSNHRIQKFTSSGTFVTKCGSKGAGNGQFSEKGPKAIAVGAEDSVWVTDYSNRVQKFTSSCVYSSSITGFTETAGIDIAPSGHVWITDSAADKVKVYSEAGALQRQFGTAGSGLGQLNGADGLEVDSKKWVWIVEGDNDRIQQFNEKGEYRAQFGTGSFTLTSPIGLTNDGKGGLWVVDHSPNRLQKWLVPKG